MWYLQHEVVSGAYGFGNKFGITRILRMKVLTKAPQPLVDKGMNFGVRVAFDSANCTGPSCDFSWHNYGYNVGCNDLGDYPYPDFNTHYAGGIWYSLPGRCPSMPFWAKSDDCKTQEPGGLCTGIPTGTGTCTWSYEIAGEISLEDLYASAAPGENSIESRQKDFWANPEDDAANERKVKAAQALFESKYGADLPSPPCDFDFGKFYFK